MWHGSSMAENNEANDVHHKEAAWLVWLVQLELLYSGDAWAVVSSSRVRHRKWSTVFGSFDGAGATLATAANVQVMKLQIQIQEIQSECSTQSSQTCQKMQRTCQLKLLKERALAIMWSWASQKVPCAVQGQTQLQVPTSSKSRRTTEIGVQGWTWLWPAANVDVLQVSCWQFMSV